MLDKLARIASLSGSASVWGSASVLFACGPTVTTHGIVETSGAPLGTTVDAATDSATGSPSTDGASTEGASTGSSAPDDTASDTTSPVLPEPPPPPICNGEGTLVDHWVHIDGTELDERSALEDIAVIDGDLVIYGAPDSHLDFLACITEITGSLYIHDNDNLVDVEGLYWLDRVGGDVVISDNDALEQFWALAQISELTPYMAQGKLEQDSSLVILGNEALVSVPGLSQLQTIFGSLIVRDNPNLVDIGGLVGIAAIGRSFAITHNPQLCMSQINALGQEIESPETPPGDWTSVGNNEGC